MIEISSDLPQKTLVIIVYLQKFFSSDNLSENVRKCWSNVNSTHLSSNLSVMFLAGSVVHVFAALTPFINHVRTFIAVRTHRNEVLDVAGSNQQQATILKRERKVAYHMMIALLICSLLY